MKFITVTYHGKDYKVKSGTSAEDFIQNKKIQVQEPVACVINGHMTRLIKTMKADCVLEYVEAASPQGQRVYNSSVVFLFVVAFRKLFPNKKLFIQHSLSNGIYVEVKDYIPSLKEISLIKRKMNEMTKKEMPIRRLQKDWDASIEQFAKEGRSDMVTLLRYYPPSAFKVYELAGIEENFYYPIAINTKLLKWFDLIKFKQGAAIVLPNLAKKNRELIFHDQPKLFSTYNEYNSWKRILKIRTVGQLNAHNMSGDIGELIKVGEALHEKKVALIADQITKQKKVPRVILISGPSSSGKTTFAKRLSIQLLVNNFRPLAISIDNYFVDREKSPKDENGDFDFESIEAIDIALFNKNMKDLLSGKPVHLPKYDFHTGRQKFRDDKITIDEKQILLVEGIHALNEKLSKSIPDDEIFKIYISPLTQLNLHNHDRIATSDTRIIRRIVRDSLFRGYTASETLARWPSVRSGENINIFPSQEEADVVFNSALFYELSVLKRHAERELLMVTKDDPNYPEARRLLKFLSYFLQIDQEDVPKTSILREFIGGSSFRYV